MKTALSITILIVCLNNCQAQVKKKALPSHTITINTLIHILDKLNLEDADDYFLLRGFEYNGSPKKGDTTTIQYKRFNSFDRISIELINGSKENISFYTQYVYSAGLFNISIKKTGFIVDKINTYDNNITTFYSKKPYLLMSSKTFFPEDGSTGYSFVFGHTY